MPIKKKVHREKRIIWHRSKEAFTWNENAEEERVKKTSEIERGSIHPLPSLHALFPLDTTWRENIEKKDSAIVAFIQRP